MRSSRDTSDAHAEVLTWSGVAVLAWSMVSYFLASVYRGLDSLFTAQKAAPFGGVGFVFAALVGLAIVFIGLGWSSVINRRHSGRHEVPVADSQIPNKTIAA